MAKKKKYTITQEDYVKAVRKADREREIEQHGKPIALRGSGIKHKSKKLYDRKREKEKDISNSED